MYKSRWYTDEDVKCQDNCGLGMIHINEAHLMNMDALCDEVGEKIPTTSWVRCHKHNKEVGGKDGSRHLYAEATDCSPIQEELLYKVIKAAINLYMGIGLYQKDGHHLAHLDSWKPRIFTY